MVCYFLPVSFQHHVCGDSTIMYTCSTTETVLDEAQKMAGLGGTPNSYADGAAFTALGACRRCNFDSFAMSSLFTSHVEPLSPAIGGSCFDP